MIKNLMHYFFMLPAAFSAESIDFTDPNKTIAVSAKASRSHP